MQLIINESRIIIFPKNSDAEDFIVKEREHWNWLAKLPDQLQKAAKELQKQLIDTAVVNALHPDLEKSKSDKEAMFYLGTLEVPFITHDSEEGVFLQQVLKNYDYVVAFYCVLHLNDNIRYLALNNSILSETLRMGRYEYEKVTAMTLSLSLGNYSSFTSARYQTEFNKVLEQQRVDQNEFKARSDDALKKQTATVKQQLNIVTTASQKSHTIISRRIKALKKLSSKGAAAASTAVEDSKSEFKSAVERLAAAATAYTEQLDLKHSVNYWKTRKNAHTWAKYGWLAGVALSLVLMLGSVAFYFANDGLTGIARKLTPAPVTAAAQTTNDDTRHAQPSRQEDSTSSISTILTKSEITTLATNLTGAILLITLISIVIKIALRQFSIHTQYALEASERVTFIKTYLALMQEKQIKSDEDRKLILECIFKPTFGSTPPEIAFSLPIDAIMKALGDKKP